MLGAVMYGGFVSFHWLPDQDALDSTFGGVVTDERGICRDILRDTGCLSVELKTRVNHRLKLMLDPQQRPRPTLAR